MKLASILMQKMLMRNPVSLRSARVLMSSAMASYGLYYGYTRGYYPSLSVPSNLMLAEAEPTAAKQDPYTRSRDKQLMKNHEDAVIIGGHSNPKLAQGVAQYLGASLAKSEVKRFADGETSVKVIDNVNGKNVYIVQPTCPPVNEHLMELLLTISACKRAGAASVTCIIPYYGYAR